MSDFGKGFLFGSWLNGGNNGGGSNGGGSDGSGCAYGCLIIVVLAILGIIGTMFTFILALIPQLYGTFMSFYDNLLVKIVLFPSTFDFLIDWQDHYYIRAVALFAGFVLLWFIAGRVKKLTTVGYVFLGIQNGLLFLRFLGTLVYAISISIFGENDYFVEDKTDLKVIENVTSIYNVMHDSINFEYLQQADGSTMSDMLGDGKHANYLFMNAVSPNDVNQPEERSISLDIEPKKTFYFLGIKESDEFRTTISYVPITEGADWGNQTEFTITFIVNEQEVKSVTLSPENPVIPINISLDDAESFSIFVKGNAIDRSIITLLSPTFSAKM
ncbi:hypothetical protein [Psychrobacillus sp. FSL H8-0487]|uniref:hypothetical protein n=1 Tax=Psychrobacillus sp. FSL H8-0487 TaxID=2921391 RepID=UPI0030F88F9A